MADEHRKFAPSEWKLKDLRSKGVVPVSQDLLTLGAILGFWAAFAIAANFISGKFFRDVTTVLAKEAPKPLLLVKQFAWHGFEITIAVLLVILVSVVCCGLFQTKFLFTLRRLTWNFGQIAALFANLFQGLLRRIVTCVFSLTKIVIVGVLTFSVVLIILEHGESLWSYQSLAESIATLRYPLLMVSVGTILVVALVAVISRIVVVSLFFSDHRMSQAELEAESRETELMPEFRKQLRERLRGA